MDALALVIVFRRRVTLFVKCQGPEVRHRPDAVVTRCEHFQHQLAERRSAFEKRAENMLTKG